MTENCPVCQTHLTDKPMNASATNGYAYECPRCGNFIMSYQTKAFLPRFFDFDREKGYDTKVAILSHAIRKMQKNDEWPTLDGKLIQAILKRRLPTPAEQKDIFIRWIGDSIKTGGNYIKINKYSIQAIIGAIDLGGFDFILKHLKTEKLIEDRGIVRVSGVPEKEVDIISNVTLLFDGWQYYEQLKKGAVNSRTAFMAMKYADPELDGIVDNYFKDAIKHTGFELFRLTEKPKAGSIDDRLRVEIRNARFLIADLTHGNAGAYWEAGYAEGLGKPVIYTCKKEVFESKETQPHFDTNHHLTVIWDSANIQEAVDILKATIRATLPDETKLSDD